MRRLASLVLIATALPSSPAFAYFCTRVDATATSPTQAWQSRCIPYYISFAGTNFDSDERVRLVDQSFKVWSSEACTDITFVDRGRTTETEAFDVSKPEKNLNVVASIEDDASVFPDSRLLAITLTRFSVATGEILDADILLNAVQFRFDDVTDQTACMSGNQVFDLRNTLVHEMGHFIGFDHNESDPEATMFPQADKCEIKKRDLGEDDRMGLCHVYAKGEPTMTCTPPATYTPSGGLDPTKFRDQCSRPALPIAAPGGCSCAVNHETNGLFVFAVFALLARRGRRNFA